MTTAKPRRKHGEGSVYRRPNGTYAGVVELGLDTEGNRRRRTVYGKTERIVLSKMFELRRQLAEHGDIPTADMTVGKWLTYWLAEIAAKRVKPSTLASYRTAVNTYLIPTIGNKPLSKLSPANVREMHRYITTKTGRRGEALSSTTALNAHRILSAALNDAVREGRVGRNVAALVRAPSKALSGRTGLTAEQAMAVLTVAGQDDRLGSRWLAAFLLGLRQGERLGLRWSYLDLDTGMGDISWSLQRVPWAHGCGGSCRQPARACPAKVLPVPDGMEYEQLFGNLVLMRPKTQRSRRVVPLPEPLLLALQARHRQVQAEKPLYDVDHDLVWCRTDGQPIHPHDDWLDWRALLDAAGVKRVTLHEARHTTATLLLEAGVDAEVVKQILGHSDILTSRSYQHVSVTLARQALAEVAGRLELT
jgi:integrase